MLAIIALVASILAGECGAIGPACEVAVARTMANRVQAGETHVLDAYYARGPVTVRSAMAATLLVLQPGLLADGRWRYVWSDEDARRWGWGGGRERVWRRDVRASGAGVSRAMMTFGSLFSGIGGFDLAMERAGMTCAWQVEIDGSARSVLAQHWPNVRQDEDVRDVGATNLGSVDLVCGGFPCQDLSVAGKRAGLAGERSGLWYEFHRIVAELRPQWVVIENVPGLLSSANGRDFAAILRGLAELRYLSAWRVLDAQHFGVPQRRRRVFVVASLGDGRAAEVLLEPDCLRRDSAASGEAGQDIAGCLTGGVAAGRSHGKRSGSDRVTMVAAPIAGHHHRQDLDNETCVTHTLRAEGADASEDGTGRGTPLVAYNWQSGGDVRHGFGLPMLQANQVPAVGVRRLTPRECERLQGFPDDWTAGESDSARYRQLGNAVAVPVAEWIGQRIVAATWPGARE